MMSQLLPFFVLGSKENMLLNPFPEFKKAGYWYQTDQQGLNFNKVKSY